MQRSKFFTATLLAVILGFASLAAAQPNFNGGKGLTYVTSAWTLDPGYLTVTGFTRSFGKVGNFATGAVTIWDVSGRVSLNYGLSRHFELVVAPQVYQDTNRGGSGVNLPSDLFVQVKVGSFSSPGSSLAYGALLSTRFPLGKTQNIPFEPYTTQKFSWGVGGMMTYSRDPLYPEEGTSVHVNLGYWNHNDVGAELAAGGPPQTKPGTMSQEILYGVGVRVPKDVFDISAELYGNVFIQTPPTAAYSRENYLYFTPSVTYKPIRWFAFNFGVDIRLLEGEDTTDYTYVSRTLPGSQPNYGSWRVNLGAKFTLLPTSVYKTDERDILMQKAETRRELFEQIIKEQRETEAAESELERIKAERIRAEKELERLRRILEGRAGKTQEGNGTETEKEKDKKKKSDKDDNQ